MFVASCFFFFFFFKFNSFCNFLFKIFKIGLYILLIQNTLYFHPCEISSLILFSSSATADTDEKKAKTEGKSLNTVKT